MHRVEEAIGPEFGINALPIAFAARQQHAESGQILVFTSQAIAQPGTHAGTVAHLSAGLEKR